MASALACLVLLLAFAVVLHRHSMANSFPKRLIFADVAACLVAAFFYALFLLCSSRPLFSLAACALLLAGLWAVNTAKMKALRGEPLVFTDLPLAWQVLRFPRLYLPFLPCASLILGATAGGAALVALWRISSIYTPTAIWLLAAWPLPAFILLKSRYGDNVEEFLLKKFPLRFDPRTDAQHYGPLGAALLHVCWHLTMRGRWGVGVINVTSTPPSPPPWPRQAFSLSHDTPRLPNIFLVQAESFADPREFSPLVPDNILPTYDTARTSGMTGKLTAAPFGAYTMRTEFSVLTGQAPAQLGTDAFHPYLSASRYPTWSLAHYLRRLGYRTICLHPFHGRFFFRHRAIPNLGFDAFVTANNFLHKKRYGPYVSDDCVARGMLETLEKERPVFCFAITMENHGPWLKGRLCGEDAEGTEPHLPGLDPQVHRYLTHLRHADAMIGILCRGLRQELRPGVLGWYGDHLPNLPMLIPPSETATPCFIWNTYPCIRKRPPQARGRIAPEEFGGLLLQYAAQTLPHCADNNVS